MSLPTRLFFCVPPFPPPYPLPNPGRYYTSPLSNNLYGGVTVRRVTIFYFLEDDTISAVEELAPNTGFQSGTIVKKARQLKVGSLDATS